MAAARVSADLGAATVRVEYDGPAYCVDGPAFTFYLDRPDAPAVRVVGCSLEEFRRLARCLERVVAFAEEDRK